MLALIAALSKNNVIGNKGSIPWKIKGEQRRFKELTTGNVVIMGRCSFEEIGHPLPDRQTIVISKTVDYTYDNCVTLGSLQEALEYAGDKDAYVSGGEQLYREALPLVDRIYLTRIDIMVEGDTFFPEFEEVDFDMVSKEEFEGDIPYVYLEYVRKKKAAPEEILGRKKYIAQQDNLALRYASVEDAKLLCTWWNDGRVMAHAGFPNGLNTTVETIIHQMEAEDEKQRRLIIEINGIRAGEMSFYIKGATADIGIKICDSNQQEKGYGTKAIKMLIKYLFTDKDVDKIHLDTNLNNARAQHVYEKIGFIKTKINIDAWKDQLGDMQSFVEYELEKCSYS